jgi:hypothetical protein
MEKISEIWIINQNGTPLFNRSSDTKVDPSLFGGFLSAIQEFIRISFHGTKLDTLSLGTIKLFFLPVENYNIFIVVRCDKKVNDKDMKKNIEKIRDIFISKFQSILEKPLMNVEEFQSFNEDLNNLLGPSKLLKKMTNWFETI